MKWLRSLVVRLPTIDNGPAFWISYASLPDGKMTMSTAHLKRHRFCPARLQYSKRCLDGPRIFTISSLPVAPDKYKPSGGTQDARCTQCIRCRVLGYLDISHTSPSPGINRKAFIEPSFPQPRLLSGRFLLTCAYAFWNTPVC